MSTIAGGARTTRPGNAPARSAASLVAWATSLTLVGSAWLVWLAGQPSTGAAVRTGPHGIAAWMMTSLLALPVVIGGVWVATQLSRLVRRTIGTSTLTVTLDAVPMSSAGAIGLGTGWHLPTSFAGADPPVSTRLFSTVLDLPATLVATLLLTAVVAGLTVRSPRPRAPRRRVGIPAGTLGSGTLAGIHTRHPLAADALNVDGHPFAYENRYGGEAGNPEARSMDARRDGISASYPLALTGGTP